MGPRIPPAPSRTWAAGLETPVPWLLKFFPPVDFACSSSSGADYNRPVTVREFVSLAVPRPVPGPNWSLTSLEQVPTIRS